MVRKQQQQKQFHQPYLIIISYIQKRKPKKQLDYGQNKNWPLGNNQSKLHVQNKNTYNIHWSNSNRLTHLTICYFRLTFFFFFHLIHHLSLTKEREERKSKMMMMMMMIYNELGPIDLKRCYPSNLKKKGKKEMNDRRKSKVSLLFRTYLNILSPCWELRVSRL